MNIEHLWRPYRPATVRKRVARSIPRQPVYRRPVMRPKSKKTTWEIIRQPEILITIIGSFLLLIPFIFLLVYSFLTVYMGFVAPGVRVGSVDVGLLNPAAAVEKLSREWNSGLVLVTDGANTLPAAAYEFGLGLDTEASIAAAREAGPGDQVAPVVSIEPAIARKQIEQYSGLVDRKPKDATLAYLNGQWTIAPGKDGVRLDVEKTLQALISNPGVVYTDRTILLYTQPIPHNAGAAFQELQGLQSALSKPLQIRVYDPISDEDTRLDISPEQYAAWIGIQSIDNETRISLDSAAVWEHLQNWQANLGQGRSIETLLQKDDLGSVWQSGEIITALVRHAPTQYTVQTGDTLVSVSMKVGMPYWKILEANPGINQDQLSPGQVLTIPSKNEMIPLPVVPDKRIVISISQQRMWTYENRGLRSEHVISTGIARSPTIPGIYQVQTHELEAYASVWDLYMPHFLGIYEGWPGFWNGIHGLPTLSSGVRLWADVLGRPASYGCIILDLQAAENLYQWAENGVIVEIQP